MALKENTTRERIKMSEAQEVQTKKHFVKTILQERTYCYYDGKNIY